MGMSGILKSFLCFMIVVIMATGCCVYRAEPMNSIVPAEPKDAVSYQLLKDVNDSVIQIGVRPDISDLQLKDILAKAADDHQDDTARDYMSSSYLWVEAYLVSGGRSSRVAAGSLRRYVPLMNPEERHKLKVDRRRFDKYEITLGKARKSIE